MISNRFLNFGVVFLWVALSACPSPGVETGNPQIPGRKITGVIDEDSPASLLTTATKVHRYTAMQLSAEDCEDLDEVEARAIDLSGNVTADVVSGNFEMTVDPEKTYTFLAKSDGNYCGILYYDHSIQGVCRAPNRIYVVPGNDDIDLGVLGISSHFGLQVSTYPAVTEDRDGDGTVDAYDSDMNGDGVTDFDGNYDGFINPFDSSDTTTMAVCDLESIVGSETGELGTVTANSGQVILILTPNQGLRNFDVGEVTIHNVDDSETVAFASVGSLEDSAQDDSIQLVLTLGSNKDYVLTLPAGSFTCADGIEQTREITYYFRVVDYGVIYSCDESVENDDDSSDY